jgi:antitoxin HicB
MTDHAYPARFAPPDEEGWITVEFRGIPAVTQGRSRAEAHANAIDALSTAIWYMLREGDPIAAAPKAEPGEVMVWPEPAVVLKLELLQAATGARGEAARIARGLGISHKDARHLLDRRKVNRADRLARALAVLGRAYAITCHEVAWAQGGAKQRGSRKLSASRRETTRAAAQRASAERPRANRQGGN